MPKFKIKAAPKCSVCKKSAYPAERVDIFDISVHKLCFNCTTCQKKLTLNDASINTDTGLLFCKTHFADQLRTNDGARFAQGAKNVAAKMMKDKELKKPGSSKALINNMDQGGLLQEELDFLRNAKYDKQLEAQVKSWIESVSGKTINGSCSHLHTQNLTLNIYNDILNLIPCINCPEKNNYWKLNPSFFNIKKYCSCLIKVCVLFNFVPIARVKT